MMNVNTDLWYLVELRGWRKRAGRLSQVDFCGQKYLQIEMPLPTGDTCTEQYHPSAIYSFRVIGREEAYRIAEEIWREWEDF